MAKKARTVKRKMPAKKAAATKAKGAKAKPKPKPAPKAPKAAKKKVSKGLKSKGTQAY